MDFTTTNLTLIIMRSIYETRQEQLALPKHNLLILANSRVEINTPNFLKQKTQLHCEFQILASRLSMKQK